MAKQSSTNPEEMSVQDALQLGIKYHRAGRLREAEEVYGAILKSAPEHPDALHYLGVAKHQAGESVEAVELIRRAVEIAPEYLDAHNNLGNIYKSLGQFEEATGQFRRCIELKPDFADAHNNLGVILRRDKQLDAARQAFQRAIDCDPEHPESYYNLGDLLRQFGEVEEASACFEKALNFDPRNPDLFLNLNQSLRHMGRVKEAEAILDDWLRFEPGNATALHLAKASRGGQVAARASDEYVRQQFDEAAGHFESRLAELEYRAPQLVDDYLAVALEASEAIANRDVLDAGCGTGLCGPFLKPYAKSLVGVDLSGKMINIARDKKLYDDLVVAELTQFLTDHPASYDIVACADTLVYFGELETVFAATKAAIRPGGLFLFTVESLPDDAIAQFEILFQGRYSHKRHYVRDTLEAAGFVVDRLDATTLRLECAEPVFGSIVVARVPEATM